MNQSFKIGADLPANRFRVGLLVAAALLTMAQPVRADLGGTVGGIDDAGAPDVSITRDLYADPRPVVHVPVPASDLRVTAWVNSRDNTYKPGEILELMVQTDRDAHVTVIDIATSGKVHILFPNRYQPDNHVKGGEPVKIPGGGDGFQLRVRGPAGTEVLKVIATTSSAPLFPETSLTAVGPFKVYDGDGDAAARDLEMMIRRNAAGSAWAEYLKVIRIVDGAPADVPPVAQVASPAAQVAVGGPVAPGAVAVVPPVRSPGSGFGLSVATDKPVYRIGENALVSATTERDCRLTLVNVGSSGKVHVLYPNAYQPDNALKAGRTVTIPSAAAPVDFRVMGPDGLEALIGICRADDTPVLSSGVDYRGGPFPAYGDVQALAKDLAAALRQPSSAIAHAATSFLVAR